MKRTRLHPSPKPRRERGQILMTVVVAMVVMLVFILFLFDLQGIIRLRARSQTAADAAALAGAAWQGRTLNMIGELNLLKATSIMLKDAVPGEENTALITAAEQITQMQARLTYTGPLMGLAAAQQAARFNGLYNTSDYTNNLQEHVNTALTAGGEYESIYTSDPDSFGFEWIPLYYSLLVGTVRDGIAASPSNIRFLNGDPKLNGPGGDLLADPDFYSAVYGFRYCFFYRKGIGPDHAPIDLNGLTYNRTPQGYFPGSEFLPLYVNFTSGISPAHLAEMSSFLADRGLQALPPGQAGLQNIRWAVYETAGDGWDQTGRYDFVNTYLRSPFRPEYTYGGACARFVTTATPQYLSGSWSWKYGESAGNTPAPAKRSWFGSVSTSSNAPANDPISTLATDSDTPPPPPIPPGNTQWGGSGKVTSVAAAKPFGSFGQGVPQSSGIVLPVFTEVRLIPVALAPSSVFSEDPGFYRFLVDYFGNPNYPNVPDDIKKKYAYYLKAIELYNDPNSLFSQGWWKYDEWRKKYMAGPDGIPGTGDDRKDPCTPNFPPGGGGGGSRGGPDIIH